MRARRLFGAAAAVVALVLAVAGPLHATRGGADDPTGSYIITARADAFRVGVSAPDSS
jgi:hypothetical protein